MKTTCDVSNVLYKTRNPETSTKGIQIYRCINKRYVVPERFYGLIGIGVRQMMPFLGYGHTYSPAQLLGFWSELNSAEARIAEFVIAHQVQRGELALVAAKRGANGSATYKLG